MDMKDTLPLPTISPEDEKKLTRHSENANSAFKATHKQTGFEDKTRWDKLDLFGKLAIPILIAIATITFGFLQFYLANMQHQHDQQSADLQHMRDQQSALDQQQAAILQTYIDNIQDLLLHDNLLISTLDIKNPYYVVAVLARARTLTALQGLDPDRKGRLVLFLYEAQLIRLNPIIDLNDANLEDANLSHTNLRNASLSLAMLTDARLINTDLTNDDLTFANLSNAHFDSAYLDGANLDGTNLRGTILTNAYLRGATLSGANLSAIKIDGKLTLSNLSGANFSGAYFSDAKLTDGSHIPPANLSGANLSGASLSGANLSGANLSGANLSGANLSVTFINGKLTPANLTGALITQKQLDSVSTCKGAILPKGLTCHHNQ